MFKLICQKNPKELGIEKEDGSWDMKIFENHVKTCNVCGAFQKVVNSEVKNAIEGESSSLWYGRYKLPNGAWQSWGIWESKEEAIETLLFHAQGRDIEILSEEDYQKKYL